MQVFILYKFRNVRQSEFLAESHGYVLFLVSQLLNDGDDGTCGALPCSLNDAKAWNVADDAVASLTLVACQLGIGEIASQQRDVLLYLLVVYLCTGKYYLRVGKDNLNLVSAAPDVVFREIGKVTDTRTVGSVLRNEKRQSGSGNAPAGRSVPNGLHRRFGNEKRHRNKRECR